MNTVILHRLEQGTTCSINILAKDDSLKANISLKSSDGSVPSNKAIKSIKKKLQKVATWQSSSSFIIDFNHLHYIALADKVVARIETYNTDKYLYLIVID